MDELGSILREARETRGLTLDEAQEQTRISQRYLNALEIGDYQKLPTPVHVRGYLRNYARFLDLEPQPLLERYEVNQARLAANPRKNGERPSDEPLVPALEEQPFFNPVNMELDSSFGIDSDSGLRLVIIIALLIAIGLVANRFVPLLTGNGDGSEAVQQAVIDIVNNATGEDGETAVDDPAAAENNLFMEESAAESDEPVTATGRTGLDTALTAGPTPTRPQLPATMERVNLRLDITERTWVEVTIDGETALQDLVTPEDGPFEWEALQEARVLTGNAAGVFVTINGIELGKLGTRAQVVDESWQVTGN